MHIVTQISYLVVKMLLLAGKFFYFLLWSVEANALCLHHSHIYCLKALCHSIVPSVTKNSKYAILRGPQNGGENRARTSKRNSLSARRNFSHCKQRGD